MLVTVSTDEKTIATNLQVRIGHGIIIDANGYVRNAKPGKTWTDMSGKDH